MSDILVFGRTGQVAQSLQELVTSYQQYAFTFVEQPDVDLSKPETIVPFIEAQKPAAVINAAAYTNTDKAEEEPELAHLINAVSPGEMAKACKQNGDIPFLHISTDYVFRGDADTPYKVDDPIDPISVYGKTKADGEALVRQATAKHLILRTAWVYSPFGSNFLLTMLRLAQSRDTLSVVDDQHGCPTTSYGIAGTLLILLKKMLKNDNTVGTYQYTGNGQTTWCGFANEIFKQAHYMGMLPKIPEVQPTDSASFPAKIDRPKWSVLDCSNLVADYGVELQPWQQGITQVLSALKKRQQNIRLST